MKLFPDLFFKSQNWAYRWINSLKFYAVCFDNKKSSERKELLRWNKKHFSSLLNGSHWIKSNIFFWKVRIRLYSEKKLFSSLEIERSTRHERKERCLVNLTEEETNILNTCFETSSITENERSSRFYIRVYIVYKGKFMILNQEDISDWSESEFTKFVPSGKLDFPDRKAFWFVIIPVYSLQIRRR